MEEGKKREAGYALPVVMIALLLSMGMLQHAHERAVHFIRIRAIEASGRKEYAAAVARTPLSSPRVGSCSPVPGADGIESAAWWACYEPMPALKPFPSVSIPEGRPNVEAIFAGMQPCPVAPRAAATSAFDSPTARFTCSPTGSLAGDLIVADNILSPGLGWTTGSAQGARMIATPGLLAIDALIIDGDTIAFAGGNISIGTITSKVRDRATVTVISMHGTVDVAAAGSGVSLLVVGPKSLRAPLAPPPAAFPYPPTRLPSLISLTALNGNGT